jgi:hypothetical protein
MSELQQSYEYQEQAALMEKLLQPQPTVIAIEGGPCGGKSTLMAEIEQQATVIDRPLVMLPEVATNHIRRLRQAGTEVAELMIVDRPAYLQFQKAILMEMITGIEGAIESHKGTNALIITDRCDIGAYVTPEEYRTILQELGHPTTPALAYVDQLYYLPSVASENPEQYDQLRATNVARYENADEARETCQANLVAIQNHPELHIAWGGDFTGKIRHVANAIMHPELETEMKQQEPNETAAHKVLEAAHKGNLLHVHDIHQSYHELSGQSFRLRKSTDQLGLTTYFFTVKNGQGVFREETQRRVTQAEHTLLRNASMIGNELHKARHIILDEPDEISAHRRLWFADQYHVPILPVWHFETDVDSQEEVDELELLYAGVRDRLQTGAKELVFI